MIAILIGRWQLSISGTNRGDSWDFYSRVYFIFYVAFFYAK